MQAVVDALRLTPTSGLSAMSMPPITRPAVVGDRRPRFIGDSCGTRYATGGIDTGTAGQTAGVLPSAVQRNVASSLRFTPTILLDCQFAEQACASTSTCRYLRQFAPVAAMLLMRA